MVNGSIEASSTILITDDRDEDREMLKEVFVNSCNIELATNGQECLNKIKDKSIDLVLLDINMPDMNGLEVLREIKKTHPYMPVVMITGVGTHEATIESIKFGAATYIAKPFDVPHLREVVKELILRKGKTIKEEGVGYPTLEEILKNEYRSTIKSLSELIEMKNPYTRVHSKQVAKYAVMIAKEMGFSERELEVIEQAALIHDIGKVGISDTILNKPAKLTEEEYEIIKQHPVLGVRALKHMRLLQTEVAMIKHHHERWDGKGYPDGLKGEEIPLVARILGVADAFDAMTSDRAYRQAHTREYALNELKTGSGAQFDPKVVEAFVKVLEKELKNNTMETT